MIIFAQDKKNIVDCARITIEKNIGGKKDEKYFIVGRVRGVVMNPTSTLGKFSDEESAMAELEKIYVAFEAGTKTYRVE